MSTDIKYTAAERASFELVPATCDDIERGFDVAFRGPRFTPEYVAQTMAKYNIVLTDYQARQMGHALYELTNRELFIHKMAIQDTVKFEGTFPLRLALVQEIARGRGLDNTHCNYEHWMRMHGPRVAGEKSVLL